MSTFSLKSFTINLSINVDLKTLVKHISEKIGQNLSESNFSRLGVFGGVFIVDDKNGKVVAAYNHPTKNHSVHIDGQLIKNVSNAGPGIWAVVFTTGPANLFKIYFTSD